MNLPDLYRGETESGRQLAPFTGVASPVSDRLNFRALSGILRRRIKLFWIVVFLVFQMAVLITAMTKPQYTATSGVVINTMQVQVAPRQDQVLSQAPPHSEDVDTEVQILLSRDLATKVVDYLKLGDVKDYVGLLPASFSDRLARMAHLQPYPRYEELGQTDKALMRQLVIDRVLANLRVERLRTAYAMNISYTDPNPVRAATVANAYARLYSQEQIALKQQANTNAEGVLRGKITELREQAQRDVAAVQKYRIANNLLSTTGASLTEQEMSAYNQQVAQARAQAAEDRARLDAARAQIRAGAKDDDGDASLVSPVANALRAQRAALSIRVAELTGRYGDRHPDLATARRELQDIDQQIGAELSRAMSSLEAQERVSQDRLRSLSGSLGGARGALAQNNRAMVGLDDLVRKATTSQSLYESYLDRYKATIAQSGAETADSRMLTSALVPTRPSKPNVALNLVFGLLLGLGIGFAAAVIAELAYGGLTTGDEVEDRLGVRYWGGIPLVKSIDKAATSPLEHLARQPRSAFAEALRNVLASIRHSGGKAQVIAITSALPHEGKTSLTASLARIIAAGGERVVMVDCDVMRSRLSQLELPEASGRPGLREVLRDGLPFDQAIMTVEGTGVDLLPITTSFLTSGSLTDKGGIHAVVAQLRERYDLVILDCPPVLPVAEARDLAAIADKVILVAAWRRTQDSAIKAALSMIPPSAFEGLGVVLSQIDMRRQSKFGGGDATTFYHHYKSYYGN